MGLLQRICPHWYWAVPDYGHQIMIDVTKRERCKICGQTRVHAKVPEPHPSREKEEVVEKLQHDEFKVVVTKWKPYGTTVNPGDGDE